MLYVAYLNYDIKYDLLTMKCFILDMSLCISPHVYHFLIQQRCLPYTPELCYDQIETKVIGVN